MTVEKKISCLCIFCHKIITAVNLTKGIVNLDTLQGIISLLKT